MNVMLRRPLSQGAKLPGRVFLGFYNQFKTANVSG